MNIKRKIIEGITYEDLKAKEQLQEIADIIGLESTKKLIEMYSGVPVYIPQLTHFDSVVKRVVLEEIKTNNLIKISKELGITYRTLKKRVEFWKQTKG